MKVSYLYFQIYREQIHTSIHKPLMSPASESHLPTRTSPSATPPNSCSHVMYRTFSIASTIALIVLGLHAALDTSLLRRLYDTLPPRRIAQTTPFRAPVVNFDAPGSEKVPGAYGVYLKPGASFEEHKASVSGNIHLDAHIRRVYDQLFPGQVYYHGFNISDAALDAIRADTRVVMVECPMTAWTPEGDSSGWESRA